MIMPMPLLIAAANGLSSRFRRTSSGASMIGSSRWESTLVSPWPGKCLPQARTPLASIWVKNESAFSVTASGVFPKDRAAMTGLFGAVDVQHGREVEIYAQRGQFGTDRAAHAARVMAPCAG